MIHPLITDAMIEKAISAYGDVFEYTCSREEMRAALEAVANDFVEAIAVRAGQCSPYDGEIDQVRKKHIAAYIRTFKSPE